jgi:simple sugar transport system permease protein
VTGQLLASGINGSFLVIIVASAVVYGTPLLFAALGELLAERSGVLNLGVEGMMLVGAVMGFWAVQRLGAAGGVSLAAALTVAAIAGAAMALIHAFLVITLRANQIVSGLALTIFAGTAGLSAYLGNDLNLSGAPAAHAFTGLDVAGLADLPIVGPILFHQSALVYLSWLCVLAIGLYLARTRPGLNLRAVGESPGAADAMGINVTAYRYAHTLAGGALAGVGGACFSLQITPQWVGGLTGGAGWIAVALVIFAFWRADLCLLGAYLFGAFSALPFALQARGWLTSVPSEIFQSLPYVMTVVVLVAVSSSAAKRRLGAPAALGIPYVREER